jgi:hypothetical protein
MDFGRRLDASDAHIPQWICKERATTPPPKRHAALWVAHKLAWGFVAQSVEDRCGYTPSFAPRPRPIYVQRMYSYFRDTTLRWEPGGGNASANFARIDVAPQKKEPLYAAPFTTQMDKKLTDRGNAEKFQDLAN